MPIAVRPVEGVYRDDSPFRYAHFSGGLSQHTTISASNWRGPVLTELRLNGAAAPGVDLTGPTFTVPALKGMT